MDKNSALHEYLDKILQRTLRINGQSPAGLLDSSIHWVLQLTKEEKNLNLFHFPFNNLSETSKSFIYNEYDLASNLIDIDRGHLVATNHAGLAKILNLNLLTTSADKSATQSIINEWIRQRENVEGSQRIVASVGIIMFCTFLLDFKLAINRFPPVVMKDFLEWRDVNQLGKNDLWDIFISFHETDQQHMENFHDHLLQNYKSITCDNPEINIPRSKRVLLLISNAYLQSRDCQRYLSMAYCKVHLELSRCVIPILLEKNLDETKMPLWLRLDGLNKADYKQSSSRGNDSQFWKWLFRSLDYIKFE